MDRRRFLRAALLSASALPLVGCAGVVPRARAQPGAVATARRLSADFTVSGKIAYVKGGDIWRWSDGKALQITRGNRYEGPDWSPDGARLAAAYMGENHSEIVVVTETGARVRQLTRHWSPVSIADQSWGRKPAWSPNGRQVAYVSDQGANIDMSLFMVDAEGQTVRRLVVMKSYTGGVDWPTWAPDGGRIAYAAYDGAASQIQVYNLTSGEWRDLTDDPEGAYDPAWSPDGKWIAYTVREKGRHDVHVMRADGSDPTRITDTGANRAPAWSPDGQLLAYVSIVLGSFEIMVSRLSLSDAMAVTDPRQLTRGENVEAPSGLSWAR